MRKTNSISNLFILCAFLLIAGCNQTFEPIKESTSAPLSIYGYLDASADTQFVRITPIRYQVEQTLEKPKMQVTLEHLSSGNKAILEDSLFQFRQGFNVINAWTEFDIEPNETYQIEATRPDGATSRVAVTLPKDFPTPGLFDYGDGCRALIRIEGVPQLVDVQSKWHLKIYYLNLEQKIVFEEEKFVSISYGRKARRIADGAYEVFVDGFAELDEIFSGLSDSGASFRFVAESRTIFIASGGPDWNEQIRELDDIEYALPEGISNIENGLGYMFGIVSRSVSYPPSDECVDPFNPDEHRKFNEETD